MEEKTVGHLRILKRKLKKKVLWKEELIKEEQDESALMYTTGQENVFRKREET